MSDTPLRSICIFCGSHHGRRETYVDAAASLGRVLSERNITVVYGGGSIGLMGAIADTVVAAEGRVIGVIPEQLAKREVMHGRLTETHVVSSMHERKALMSRLADAFIALPGGFGTLEELLEVITWAQLGIHTKPIGLLNVGGYFDPLVTMVDKGVEEGFIRPIYRDLFVSARGVGDLLEKLQRFRSLPSILSEMGIEDT